MQTKEALQQEIEETRQRYYQLLESIPEEAYSLPSDNPAWTIGEVLYHMSIAPRMMGSDVKLIMDWPRLQRWLPKLFPERLFHWLNARLTRYGARKLSHQFLLDAYDKAHAATLKSLNSLAEADLQRTVRYPAWDPLLAGEITVAYLFGYIKRHFESHAAQIEMIVKGSK